MRLIDIFSLGNTLHYWFLQSKKKKKKHQIWTVRSCKEVSAVPGNVFVSSVGNEFVQLILAFADRKQS